MRNASLSVVLAGALVLASGGVSAQTMAPGWYATGSFGANDQPGIDLYGGDEATMHTGWAASAAIGYALTPLRAELELSYRHNALDEAAAGGRTYGGSGHLDQTALMVNGYYDVPTGGPVVPYVGLGLGVVRVHADGFGAADPARGVAPLSDRETLFGGQAIVGVSYVFNPNLRFNVDYRYLRTADGSFDGPAGSESFHVANHSLMLGISYRFAP